MHKHTYVWTHQHMMKRHKEEEEEKKKRETGAS